MAFIEPQAKFQNENELAFEQFELDRASAIENKVDQTITESAFRVGVTFANRLFSDGFDRKVPKDSFSYADEDVISLMNELDEKDISAARGAESWDEFSKKYNRIVNMRDAQRNLQNELGTAGSFAAIGAISLLDPVTYLAGGAAFKLNNASKVFDSASNFKKASIIGAEAAIVEGASTAEIEQGSTEEWEAVPISAAAAFFLAGGISHAAMVLDGSSIRLKAQKIDEYADSGLSVEKDGDIAKQKIDEILDISTLTPVKNFATKIVDTITMGHNPLTASKTRYLANMGKEGAYEASKFDLLPFPMQDKNGVLMDTSKTNAMDIVYKNHEALFKSISKERLLLQELNQYNINNGMPPISKETFEKQIMLSYRKQGLEYRAEKAKIREELISEKQDIEIRKQVEEEINARIEEEGKTKDISENERIKMIEDEANIRFEEKLREEVNARVDESFRTNTQDGFVGKAVESRMEYYNHMYKEMVNSGMNSARAYDPTFYSHNEYNPFTIEANEKGAVKAFTKAIQNSPEYKEQMNRLTKQYNDILSQKKAAEKNGSSELVKRLEKDIEQNNALIEHLETKLADIDEMDLSEVMSAIENGDYHRGITEASRAFALEREANMNLQDELSLKNFLEILEEHKNTNAYNSDNILDAMMNNTGTTVREIEEIARSGYAKELNELWESAGRPKIVYKNYNKKTGDTNPSYNRETHTIKMIHGIENQPMILIHEMMHATTVHKYVTSAKFRNDIDEFFNELVLSDNFINQTKEFDNSKVKIAEYLKKELDKYNTDDKYFGYNSFELISEVFSNKKFASALNDIEWNGSTMDVKKSFFRRFADIVLSFMGNNSKINKGSILDAFHKTMDNNIASDFKIAKNDIIKSLDETTKIEQKLFREYEAYDNKIAKLLEEGKQPTKTQLKALANRKEKFILAQRKAMDEFKIYAGEYSYKFQDFPSKIEALKKNIKTKQGRIEKANTRAEKKLSSFDEELGSIRKDINDLKKLPYRQAKSSVKNIIRRNNTIREFTLDEWSGNTIAGTFKNRKLDLDETILQDEGFIKTDPDSMFRYNYVTSGKVATQAAVGFQKHKDYANHLNTRTGLSGQEKKALLDMFEDVQGTSQLADDPKATDQLLTKMASHFNYVTMGGQFSMYGLSEISAGIFRTGFRYMSQLIPAIGTTKRLYKGQALSDTESSLVFLSDATEIIENSGKSRYGDAFSPDEIFAQEPKTIGEKSLSVMSRLSRHFFRWSGLEGITTITKIAIPKALTTRILKEYAKNPNVVAKDLTRFGFTPNLLKKISEQPITKDANGNVLDFNQSKWDAEVYDEFNKLMTRAVKETIISVSGTRLPSWASRADTMWLFRLARQFMSFSMVAHERLLLSGLNERASMVIVGATVSSGILAALQIGSEEAAIALGTLKEEDRRFDTSTDKGMKNIAEYMATRNSFSGNVGQMYDLYTELTDPAKSHAASTKMLGGITAGRTIQAIRAAGEAVDGEFGTRRQANMLKSIVPYNNMVGIDFLNKHLARTVIDDEY